jgi:spore germination cell wall hydrolase CwlJ-like protein
MAHAIYFEAGNQSYEGKVAVANVIANRVRAHAYPDSICKVVTQDKQFSYLEDESKHKLVINNRIDKVAYLRSLAVGYAVAEGRINDNTGGATHYYAYKIIKPYWANEWNTKVKIHDHIFLTMR